MQQPAAPPPGGMPPVQADRIEVGYSDDWGWSRRAAAPTGMQRPASARAGRPPADLLQRYTLGAVVGRGTSGDVFRATARQQQQEAQKAEAAIKCVPTAGMTAANKEQLIKEIATMKQCDHLHIVTLLDFYFNAAGVWMALEWCGLGDLERYITRDGGSVLPERTSLHFMRQLASALRFLRCIGIVHGDLKPANLLLTEPPSPGGLPMLRVGDFGIAQSLAGEELSGRIRGTALYLAPELVQARQGGPAADLWSAGAILHRCLFGWPPAHPPGASQNDQDAALRRLAVYVRTHQPPSRAPHRCQRPRLRRVVAGYGGVARAAAAASP